MTPKQASAVMSGKPVNITGLGNCPVVNKGKK